MNQSAMMDIVRYMPDEAQKPGAIKIDFGRFKGRSLEDVPEDYLIWLAKGTGYTKDRHSTEMKFKIPVKIWIESRRILESRGYKIRGERIEKE